MEQQELIRGPGNPPSLKYQPLASSCIKPWHILATAIFTIIILLVASRTSPKQILAAQIHYSRIPQGYWDHSIRMAKSMGFNTVTTAVMWNFHEIKKGSLDFYSQGKNLPLFLQTIDKYGMDVLVKVGPYVGADWDFGGLPARLLGIQGMKIRDSNPLFLDQVKFYFKQLAVVLKRYLKSEGGNIIMIQIQNNYGQYGSDQLYLPALRQIWDDENINTNFYFMDSIDRLGDSYEAGSTIGVLDALNDGKYEYANSLISIGGSVFTEVSSGRVISWRQPIPQFDRTEFVQKFYYLLNKERSFSMRMAQGGTNFGLTAGAQAIQNQNYDYIPFATNYDFGAPISQQGLPTLKYQDFRALITQQTNQQLYKTPNPIPMANVQLFIINLSANLFSNLPKPKVQEGQFLYPFQSRQLQMFNQGLALYETFLDNKEYKITIKVHDYALVFLDDDLIQIIDRSRQSKPIIKFKCASFSCKLSILVQAMGHISSGPSMQKDLKGLLLFTSDRIEDVFFWNIYTFQLTRPPKWIKNSHQKKFPSLYKTAFYIRQRGDTFLDVSGLYKGYVWVNGYGLGRYWKEGPSHKIFCPGAWLKEGRNTLTILEMLGHEEGVFLRGDYSQY